MRGDGQRTGGRNLAELQDAGLGNGDKRSQYEGASAGVGAGGSGGRWRLQWWALVNA